MTQHNTLVIDQGTHASRCIVFDESGQSIFSVHEPVDLIRHSSVEIEQDARQILLSVNKCLQAIPDDILASVKSAALTGQRSTFVAWHKKTLQPLTMALSWQDTRSQTIIKTFRSQSKLIKNITGLSLSAHYGAGKIIWLQQHYAEINASDDIAVTPLLSFLLANLVEDKLPLVDHSNAHRSLLFDLKQADWSQECLTIFSIKRSILPDCCPIEFDYGKLKFNKIPLQIMCGDQNAALFSQGFPSTEAAYINVGTGAFILALLDEPRTDTPLLCSLMYSSKKEKVYALEATVNGAASALSWLQNKYPLENVEACLDQWLVDIQHPPVFINTIGGLASPWWLSADAYFTGQVAQVEARYVAVIESIVFMLFKNLNVMSAYVHVDKIIISGGLSNLDGLCQKLANLSGLMVQRSNETEATARGAAWLVAGRPSETWRTENIVQFAPHADDHLSQRYKKFCSEVQSLKQKQLHSDDE